MDIVLVHGGWHGGWCWQYVENILVNRGHRVFAPSLAGLADQAHRARSDLTAQDHADEIVDLITSRDLRDVTLVGHSYGGMVISGASTQLNQNISALIYLDALVPQSSTECAFDHGDPDRGARLVARAKNGLVPPTLFETWASEPAKIAWLKDNCTDHPVNTFATGVKIDAKTYDVPRKCFVLADHGSDFSFFPPIHDRLAKMDDWETRKLTCLHDVMVELPEETAAIIEGR